MAQVFSLERGELLARPMNAFLSDWCEEFHRFVAGSIIIVISLNGRASETADNLQAGFGIGVVADDVARTGIVCHSLFVRILEYGPKRFEIGVDIT